ncbi:MAG TPA: TonB-dependent receptor plug domain-containing protein [Duganella sp.]|nr:TonB-dependent receptor plug domain-containing protein [Duganella sp.]
MTGKREYRVAVYVDDMPVTLKSSNPDLKVLDLERIEVLQGPGAALV